MNRKVNIKWIIQLVLILWLSFHIRHHARITPRRHWAGEYTSIRSLIEGKPRVICCSVIPATNHKILMLLRWPDLSIPGEESRTMSPSVPSHHPPLLVEGKYTDIWCLVCGIHPDLVSVLSKQGWMWSCNSRLLSAPEILKFAPIKVHIVSHLLQFLIHNELYVKQANVNSAHRYSRGSFDDYDML